MHEWAHRTSMGHQVPSPALLCLPCFRGFRAPRPSVPELSKSVPELNCLHLNPGLLLGQVTGHFHALVSSFIKWR